MTINGNTKKRRKMLKRLYKQAVRECMVDNMLQLLAGPIPPPKEQDVKQAPKWPPDSAIVLKAE